MSIICVRLIESIMYKLKFYTIDVTSSIWYVESHVDKRLRTLYEISNFIVSNKSPL